VLLGLSRSTLYYRPTPVRESTLRIMARIDALYLEDPCSGSRRMVNYLARDPRFQESCHPSVLNNRGLEDMTNAPLQRGCQSRCEETDESTQG
jgi:hypothetical protein